MYSKEKINEIKEKLSYKKVTMNGYYKGLIELKGEIENIYDKILWDIGYSLSDAPYHGWSGEYMKNMCDIDKEINIRIKEIYAIILKATDTEIS